MQGRISFRSIVCIKFASDSHKYWQRIESAVTKL